MAEKTKTPPAASTANGISKREAVRRALEALGRDARPAQLRPYIKETFGIEMTPGHITTAKGEFLRKAARKTKSKGKGQPVAKPQEPAAPEQAVRAPARHEAGGITLEDLQTVKGLLGRLGIGKLRQLIDLMAR